MYALQYSSLPGGHPYRGYPSVYDSQTNTQVTPRAFGAVPGYQGFPRHPVHWTHSTPGYQRLSKIQSAPWIPGYGQQAPLFNYPVQPWGRNVTSSYGGVTPRWSGVGMSPGWSGVGALDFERVPFDPDAGIGKPYISGWPRKSKTSSVGEDKAQFRGYIEQILGAKSGSFAWGGFQAVADNAESAAQMAVWAMDAVLLGGGPIEAALSIEEFLYDSGKMDGAELREWSPSSPPPKVPSGLEIRSESDQRSLVKSYRSDLESNWPVVRYARYVCLSIFGSVGGGFAPLEGQKIERDSPEVQKACFELMQFASNQPSGSIHDLLACSSFAWTLAQKYLPASVEKDLKEIHEDFMLAANLKPDWDYMMEVLLETGEYIYDSARDAAAFAWDTVNPIPEVPEWMAYVKYAPVALGVGLLALGYFKD